MDNNVHFGIPLLPNEPHSVLSILIDTSGSMESSEKNNPIKQVNDWFENTAFDNQKYDVIDVAVVGFSYNAYVLHPFSPLSKLQPFTLNAGGPTAMGEGLNMAIELIKERTRLYLDLGVPLYRPVILLLTDGMSTDDLSNAIQRINDLEKKKKLQMWAAGIVGSNCEELKRITQRALYIDINEIKLNEFLDWFIASMIKFRNGAIPCQKEYHDYIYANLPDGVHLIDTDWNSF